MRIPPMASNPKALLGHRIRDLRKTRGLTQEALAEAIGKSLRTVSNFERGTMGVRIETLFRICEELGVEPRDLFEGVSLRRRVSVKRAELEGRLADLARSLDDARLELAVAQLLPLAARTPR